MQNPSFGLSVKLTTIQQFLSFDIKLEHQLLLSFKSTSII